MTTEVVRPCGFKPTLNETGRVRSVLEEPPLHRAVPATDLAKFRHCRSECLRARRIDAVLDLDHDWPRVQWRLLGDYGLRPMMGGREVGNLAGGRLEPQR